MPWLLDRLFTHHDQPAPRFAFQGTVNWIRALAIAVASPEFDDPTLKAAYSQILRRAPNQVADTLAYECLLMSLSQTATTQHLFVAPGNAYDACRAAIVSWYYAIYYASKAMLAASSGADPQTHAEAARQLQAELVGNGLLRYPFDLSVTILTPSSVTPQIDLLRCGSNSDLNVPPQTAADARGALCSYLNGTCEYRRWEIEERVKRGAPFKALGVANFRTAAARGLRDAALSSESVNFLWQAFRYRGKANYRDAIYLSYGGDNSVAVRTLNSDLATSAKAYVRMAAHYVSRRTEAGTWSQFASDVMALARFTPQLDLRAI
jgi:hypothetical protein